MPSFDTFSLLKWMHILAMGLGGGGALVALLLSGFEDERPDLRGLAATVWKRVCGWAFRLALVLGVALLVFLVKRGAHPFEAYYLHLKLVLVLALLALSEMTPKALALGKRGSAGLAMLLFLLTTFVTVNGSAFGYKQRPVPEATVQPAQR